MALAAVFYLRPRRPLPNISASGVVRLSVPCLSGTTVGIGMAMTEQRRTASGSGAADGIDKLCVDTIRTLAMDAVQKANSGHPGAPMALAPVVYTLWQDFLRFDPDDPIWPNRDRFVLSIGHASMLLYSLLHLAKVKAVNPEYETL